MSWKRRVGFITTSFPRREGDPAGGFVLGLARTLARRGHQVEVVAPEPDEPADWGHPQAPWLGGVRVLPAPYARPRRLQRLFFGAGVPDNIALAPAMAALVPPAVAGLYLTALRRAPVWDALVSHWLAPSALIAAALPRPRSRTHLAIAHSGDLHLLGRLPLGGRLAAIAVAGADSVGCVAGSQIGELRAILGPRAWERFAHRVERAPMGIDQEELRSKRARAELRDELGLRGFTVLFIGRLVPIKGLDLLIEAVADRPGWQLVVAGEGPSRGELERRARARGVAASFRGAVGPAERAELLTACDALALPSRRLAGGRHEGLPLVLLEAMAAGLPVVAAAGGGVADVVTDGRTGLLVPPEDPVALGRALVRLAGDPVLARRLTGEAGGVASERDWRRLAPRYEALLGLSQARAS